MRRPQKKYLRAESPQQQKTPYLDEHLRSALQQLQHQRLTADLQIQKRLLLQQQLKNLKAENQQHIRQKTELQREIQKLNRKYIRLRDKKGSVKNQQQQAQTELNRERQIYLNDRKLMQQQINTLRAQLQQSQNLEECHKLQLLNESLKKQLNSATRRLEQQGRVVVLLNDKLSLFQQQNLRVMETVQQLESKLANIQIDKVINQKYSTSSNGQSKKRKNGSIHNPKKTQKNTQELEQYHPWPIPIN